MADLVKELRKMVPGEDAQRIAASPPDAALEVGVIQMINPMTKTPTGGFRACITGNAALYPGAQYQRRTLWAGTRMDCTEMEALEIAREQLAQWRVEFAASKPDSGDLLALLGDEWAVA